MEFSVRTSKKLEIIDITDQVSDAVSQSGISDGFCLVFTPHATAAVTINEDYDKNVCEDFIDALGKIAPEGVWRHDKVDGNGAAHIKSAIVGPSVTIPISKSLLMLGTWQGIMLCEFDGPRERKVIVVCK